MKGRYLISALILPCFFAIPCVCQTTTASPAKTSGPCSPAITGNNNRLTIECLDPTPIERTVKFAVMIPFDTAPDSVPIPFDENPDDPMYRTYADLYWLAIHGDMTTKDAKGNELGPGLAQTKPISKEDAPSFLSRLLQYYIFRSLDNLRHNSMTVAIGYTAEARAGIETPNATPYPNEKLFQELSNNQFFQPFNGIESTDRMDWKMSPVVMPKGTEIKFIDEAKPERHLVRLDRPEYFRIEYVVENFVGTGIGNVPKHFETPHASTTMQWALVVTMHYAIQRRADDGFNPDTYAKWADALYAGLHQQLAPDEAASK